MESEEGQNLKKNLNILINKEFIRELTSYEEVKNIFNEENNNQIIKIIYFNKEIIHKILYDSDETINIESNIIQNKISNYFYLTLLLGDNIDIVNYEYSINLIRDINSQLKKTDSEYGNIILSKIIIELIRNYKGTDNFDENEENEELKNIEKNNNENIKNSLEQLKLILK